MKNIKNLFDTILETLLFLIVAGGVLYFILCAGVYTAYGADAQLQRNIDALNEKQKTIAITILAEARGEGNAGMYAVACVIQQRSCERKKTPAQICLQPWQFSIWNAGKGKVKKESELYYLWKSPSMSYARELARHVCKGHGLAREVIGHANHYCTLKTNNKWTRKSKPVKIIGNHKFFKL